MKKYSYFIVFLFPVLLAAQEKPILKTEVSSDTIGLNSTLEIVFSLENGQLKKLNPPSFDGFDVQGPSTMTSMSMVNGMTTQSSSYTYYLVPKKTGVFTFDVATCETSAGIIASEKKIIVVLENYDAPKKNKRSQFGFFNDDAPNFFNLRPSPSKQTAPLKKQEKKPKYSTEDL